MSATPPFLRRSGTREATSSTRRPFLARWISAIGLPVVLLAMRHRKSVVAFVNITIWKPRPDGFPRIIAEASGWRPDALWVKKK